MAQDTVRLLLCLLLYCSLCARGLSVERPGAIISQPSDTNGTRRYLISLGECLLEHENSTDRNSISIAPSLHIIDCDNSFHSANMYVPYSIMPYPHHTHPI